MNIIIPVGGKGERFKNKGYNISKPLIKIFDKEMILYVLDNLKLNEDDNVFIIYYNLEQINIIKHKYPLINFIKLNYQTKGASETIMLGLEKIKHMSNNKKCMLLDCDTFYTEDVLKLYRNINDNAVFYTLNYDANPIYSYIKLNKNQQVISIIEKQKISDNANTGIYCFNDIDELYYYSKYIVDNNINSNNECYISCIIDTMINNKLIFYGIEINSKYVFNLGTPEQLDTYLKNTHLFLFDLDGTLVLTDDIYYDVWKFILKDYNINLSYEIFKNTIQGNNDKYVLQQLLPSNYYNLLDNISKIKDELFINNINKIKIIDGSNDFIKYLKKLGHKIAIVTNCNRDAAEKIIKIMNIENIIDTLIIGSECSKTKPHPEPYIKAINYFNSSNNKAIIFEDSKTGISSGKSTYPKCLIGLETLYSYNELINNGVNLTLKNYNNISIDNILSYKNMNVDILKKNIILSLPNYNITNIIIDESKLKGGFISDVIALKIYTDDNILDCILKIENRNETYLSKIAQDLQLYEREYYFYESISQFVPVKIPEYYGLIKDTSFNNIGILMNNLINLEYKLNLNLNNEKINVSLNVIESLAKLHSKFWNKDLQKNFKELKKHNNSIFNPKWDHFIKSKFNKFKEKWTNILSCEQINKAQHIVDNFQNIQNSLSENNLTLCHGDVKSPNIFYKYNGPTYEPYFIDWQYLSIGKGVQDLVFFMIESFEIDIINKYKNIFKDYYYVKLQENGIMNYSIDDYNKDFENAIYYFPFFVAIWFGTISDDELIDKNFPFFFIQKLFNFMKL